MEIEAKIPLTPEQAAALRERLGPPLAVKRQADVYLSTAGMPVALRVRQDGEKACVTLKSGFEEVDGIRLREEYEPAIRPEDLETWLTIFEKLGLPRGVTVEKTREEHAYGGVHVLVDTIEGLGTFCEVESVADEREEALAKLEVAILELGLSDLPRVTDSYRKLLLAARR